jgi:phosphoribosylformylglycinamidine (FGAM) synthase-like amidotransferase family enzyme
MNATQNEKLHLIHNDNGEWISDEYAVFVSKLEATVLRVYATNQGKPLSIQHGQDGLLWCYKHELEAIDLSQQVTKTKYRNLKVKKSDPTYSKENND